MKNAPLTVAELEECIATLERSATQSTQAQEKMVFEMAIVVLRTRLEARRHQASDGDGGAGQPFTHR
jgi:hypothetical protein